MQQILTDLVAEQQFLDQYLQQISFRNWSMATPATGWDIRDTVSHLAHIEGYAHNTLNEDGSRLANLSDYQSFDDFAHSGIEQGRAMRPQDVIEWWREERIKVVEGLSQTVSKDRVKWFFGDMSARSFATARLAETWAHGLDIHAAVGEEAETTDRLRHVLVLAQKTLPWAFQLADQNYDTPVRLEGIGPMYAKYVAGPQDTDQVIRGPVDVICRIAVRRLDPDNAPDLIVEGETAQLALRLMRTY